MLILAQSSMLIMRVFVLTSMLIYLAMAMDLPPWALKSIDKIWRVSYGREERMLKVDHVALVACPKVIRPPELGGLGISQLRQVGWALIIRCTWLQTVNLTSHGLSSPSNYITLLLLCGHHLRR